MEPLYTLRPIVQWPGTLARGRATSPFSAPWRRTEELLERELWNLGAKHTVLQIAVTELDFRQDGQIRASARPAHPGVILAFDSKHGPMQYACDRFDDWQDNVRAIALALEALRKVDRYGITKRGEQYAGWKALEDSKGTLSETSALLFLQKYGGLAAALKATHPDQGGSPEEFRRVIEARDVLGL